MRILQLIDTLHPGGAEQMAVNYANALFSLWEDSHICVTRQNGPLEKKIDKGVKFHFLNKKAVYDLKALRKLQLIIRREQIEIIHAHSSSWFFAVLCKYFGADFKLIWHDHYGDSEFLESRPVQLIQFFSGKFDGVISVDLKLKEWAEKNLKSRKNIFLNNFVEPISEIRNTKRLNPFKGNTEFNLICVANLRPQKDHYTLLKAFELVHQKYNVSLHLLGKAFDDDYSEDLIKEIESRADVYYYGSKDNIYPYLYNADVGLLSSKSEALPLVLLEYGLAELPVVCTNVGSCSEIMGEDAFLVKSGDPEIFATQIMNFLKSRDLRAQEGLALYKRIKNIYSKDKIISRYIHFCLSL